MVFHFQNIPIHYEIYGSGPAKVLLHGFLESAKMWNTLLADLTKNHTILILDLPGHGKSGVLAEVHSMELMAEVVITLLEYLHIPSAHFIGHSMGGYVALAIAELFPRKVESLFLINSTPLADSEERKVNRDRAINVIDQNPQAYISMAIGNLFAASSRERLHTEIENLKNEAYSFPVNGIKAAIKGMRDRKNRSTILKNFPGQKMLILATEDPILPFAETKKVGEQCGAKVVKIDGGHMSLLENHKAVVKYLLIDD